MVTYPVILYMYMNWKEKAVTDNADVDNKSQCTFYAIQNICVCTYLVGKMLIKSWGKC